MAFSGANAIGVHSRSGRDGSFRKPVARALDAVSLGLKPFVTSTGCIHILILYTAYKSRTNSRKSMRLLW